MTLIKDLVPTFSSKLYTIALYLDCSKAFDTVNPENLVYKIYRYGGRGVVNDFITSYLLNRKHYTRINGHDSDLLTSNIGVAQGSCDGPLYFITYCNDLIKLLESLGAIVIMYADDTVIILTGKNLIELQNILNQILNILNNWFKYNKLVINKDKTKYVIYSPKNIENIEIRLDNTLLQRELNYRYLGIIIDCDIKYKDHTLSLKKKLSQLAGITYILGRKFDITAAKTFYYSFVYSKITYGIEIWGGRLAVYNCDDLNRTHKKIIKNLFKQYFPDLNYSQILKKLSILNVKDTHTYCSLQLYYKVKHCNYFPSISHQFRELPPTYNVRRQNSLYVPFPRTDSVLINFTYQIPKLWNELDNQIKNCDSLNMFKDKLKKYLIEKY